MDPKPIKKQNGVKRKMIGFGRPDKIERNSPRSRILRAASKKKRINEISIRIDETAITIIEFAVEIDGIAIKVDEMPITIDELAIKIDEITINIDQKG